MGDREGEQAVASGCGRSRVLRRCSVGFVYAV